MKRYKAAFAALLAVVLLLGMLPGAALAAGETKLTILGTTDMHGNIFSFSYEDKKETTNNGMARIATYVDTVRAQEQNVVLIDNGDTIQGTILTDDLYNKQEGEHPVITSMNYMKYDSMTLGNHEFNFGISLIDRIAAQADFPLLSANITYTADGKGLVGDYTIVERGGIKVAIIGVTTPNIPRWDGGKEGIDKLTYGDMSAAVKKCVAAIGDKADVIVVSAHAGLVEEYDAENRGDSAQKIIEENPEIDVLMVGHYHIVVNEKQGSVAVGGARNSGRDVVRFDLTVDASKKVTDSAVSVVDMAGYQPSAALRALPLIAQAQQKTLDFISGSTTNPDGTVVENPIGVATERFQPANEILGIPEGKLRDTAVMDLINQIQLDASGADVSAAALFADTSDIPAGNIDYGTIFGIYKYDNTLYRVPVTGAELKAYMEWSAACYNQWKPGDLSISFNPDKPGYLYDMFAGVDYEIDLSQPVGSRIKNVMFKGAPLKDDQALTLAVNNYRYSSALKTDKLVAGRFEWESPIAIRTMIKEYIEQNTPVSPKVDNNWKIVGVDLENPNRAALVALVNAGRLDVPYAKSLNVDDLKDVVAQLGNLKVDGAAQTAAAYAIDGETYYRLRDLAVALGGTAAAFNVAWDGAVILESGKSYDAPPLSMRCDTSGAAASEMKVSLGAATASLDAVLISENYFVTLADLAELLGFTVDAAGGIVTTK